jgi:hypothetical protein
MTRLGYCTDEVTRSGLVAVQVRISIKSHPSI